MKKIYILISIISFTLEATNFEPYESTYEPLPYTNTILKNANIYDGDGNEFLETDIIIQNGKIISIGKDLPGADELTIVDATGKWITP